MGDKIDEKVVEIKDTLVCSTCNSKNILTNKNGVRVCRKCGFREEKII